MSNEYHSHLERNAIRELGHYMSIQFCSVLSAARNEQLNGTAASHKRYLFVEIATPWPYLAVEAAKLPEDVREAIAEKDDAEVPIRFQAFYSEELASPEPMRRIFYFTLPQAPYTEYEKQEFLVPDKESAALVRAIIKAKDDQLPEHYDQYKVTETKQTIEWFVCTHGSHDFCCGKIGAPLYMDMQQHSLKSPGKHRVWRADHLGGHRFAPTALEFPAGRSWGRLEASMLEPLMDRSGDFSNLIPYYRGWSAIGKIEQLAEAEVMKQLGWAGASLKKQAQIMLQEEDRVVVEIRLYPNAEAEKRHASSAANESGNCFQVEIESEGEIEVFACTGSSSLVKKFRVNKMKRIS